MEGGTNPEARFAHEPEEVLDGLRFAVATRAQDLNGQALGQAHHSDQRLRSARLPAALLDRGGGRGIVDAHGQLDQLAPAMRAMVRERLDNLVNGRVRGDRPDDLDDGPRRAETGASGSGSNPVGGVPEHARGNAEFQGPWVASAADGQEPSFRDDDNDRVVRGRVPQLEGRAWTPGRPWWWPDHVCPAVTHSGSAGRQATRALQPDLHPHRAGDRGGADRSAPRRAP